ncbi:methionyl-tRNA synthetase [Pelomyxa schiedti]|nr:methionyl-tRNA synthetase [Pelomyxa schiedti]
MSTTETTAVAVNKPETSSPAAVATPAAAAEPTSVVVSSTSAAAATTATTSTSTSTSSAASDDCSTTIVGEKWSERVPPEPHAPVTGERNILITSALPYVNNVPHLGNLIGCVLSADVYSRYCKMCGYNTLFVCGTDEYGTTTEARALMEHCTPQEICQKFYKLHAEIYKWFDIAFDKFGRTSTPNQTKITQDIFLKLHANGYIFPESVQQLFCEKCALFLADRFVEGICPNCNAPGARGDQCDACQHLINAATELKSPKCKVCGSSPIIKSSNHLFLDLPKLAGPLSEYIEHAAAENRWSLNSLQVARAWAKELRPRCITRDLKWGTPVPLDGFRDKVFYVWFDAPIGYISIAANFTNDWEAWWKNPDNVELVQFMGKDNIPFHTVIFPATLIGTRDPWTLMKYINTTEYLNYEDDKFSKSRGIGVFGDDAMRTGIPSEVWRYLLIMNRPESSDSNFTWEDLGEKCNNELLANIGNFTHRALSFVAKFFDSSLPSPTDLRPQERDLIAKVNENLAQYFSLFEKIKLKDALKVVMQISKCGNQYIQENQPWVLVKTDIALCGTVQYIASNLVYLLAQLAKPFMPGFAKKVEQYLNVAPLTTLPKTFEFSLKPGHKVNKPEPIFAELLQVQLSAWQKQFSPNKNPTGTPMPVDLRVGCILSVNAHPSAEHLYVMDVAIESGKPPRKVVAGLKASFTPEQLLNRKAVFVCNLKPGKIRGVVSEAMVLVATPTTGSPALCQPENDDIPVGTTLLFESHSPALPTIKKIEAKAFAGMRPNIASGVMRLGEIQLFATGPAGRFPIIAVGVAAAEVH